MGLKMNCSVVFVLSFPDFLPKSEERNNLLLFIQSVLSNAPALQHCNIAFVTAFTGMKRIPPISTSLQTFAVEPVTLTDIQQEMLTSKRNVQK